ncbi:formate dehydrogenase accessory sulfurtransferase FdhD [Pseudooceanicola nitratireducens]|uniref:formate dehydrogenase accessory sulfurtransferase FdhD n=1 Tax=Pseudooceanicola nitratireducens TaxID=517719 RepID=UPI001C9439F6|nr:formate dehydrogenase accessory sulfurtransferase FdhD [Pseudooceanicola nitratireducens]MBY6158060.1 formate dehydrogenase accessory sulfurtransferase FdhD [Pseudooceanicola nitratireducens]
MSQLPQGAVLSEALELNASAPPRKVSRALAEEVPVALSYNGSTQAVMMASPSDLTDFAYGFSLTEGIITHPDQITDLSIESHDAGTELRMWLAEDQARALTTRRRAMAGPVGCGLCGIDSLSEATRALPLVTADPRLPLHMVLSATETLRAAQTLHDATRSVHAAGFLTRDGLLLAREDVGRHNALDKVIGALTRQGIAPATGAFVLTSRVSIELVQKCALAGSGMLIAVSAPTTRAIATADAAGVTLVALSRAASVLAFTHTSRLTGNTP